MISREEIIDCIISIGNLSEGILADALLELIERGEATRAGAEVEPFAYCYTDVNGKAKILCEAPAHQHEQDKRVITALYTAPPVVVPDMGRMTTRNVEKHIILDTQAEQKAFCYGWNEYRNALKAAPQQTP